MSLAHVILGLLQQQERTGYDLKTTCFDDCIAHLWQADQAQIYRTLDRLVEQGWITCTVEIQHDRPNRKVYKITEAGKAEFGGWLQTYQPPPVLRDPLLVQLHFAAQLPDPAIVALLEEELAARQRKLAECQAIALASAKCPADARERKMQQLAVQLIIQREQAAISGLQQAIRELANPTA